MVWATRRCPAFFHREGDMNVETTDNGDGTRIDTPRPVFATIAEDEPEYPPRDPYPPYPVFPDVAKRRATWPERVRNFLFGDPVWKAYNQACEAWAIRVRRIEDEHAKIVREWPYATRLTLDGTISIPSVLKNTRTGETILADASGEFQRGWGTNRPTLVRAGDVCIVFPAYTSGATPS